MTIEHFDSLLLPDTGGRIGLSACPGLGGSLARDLASLRDWGARGLLSLIEDHEFALFDIESLPEQVEALGMHWWHLPIRDRETPDEHFEACWQQTGPELRRLLGDGQSIALHCRAGLGRTGTIAARLLVEMGSEPDLAIERVRKTRPGSIETREQEAFIYRCGTV